MLVQPYPTKGEGWWVIDYYPAGSKGKMVMFPFQGRKSEALALDQELRRLPGEMSTVVSLLVKDLIPAWLEYYHNEVAPSTYADTRVYLNQWLPRFGNFRPANV